MPKEKRAREEEGERRVKKHKSRRGDREERKGSKRERENGMQVVDDDDEGVWVEKNIDMDGEQSLASTIPSSAALNLTSHASERTSPPLPPSLPTSSTAQREAWMLPPPAYQSTRPVVPSPLASRPVHAEQEQPLTEEYGEETGGARTAAGGVDFFSDLGTERKRKGKEQEVPKPTYSSRELNPDINPHAAPLPTPSNSKSSTPGGPGSSWRMLKLRRVYEEAETSGRPLEEVALERYESLEAWDEARAERRVLDEREERRGSRGGGGEGRRRDGEGEEERKERYMFTEMGGSRPTSRASSFRRPGDSAPPTPGTGPGTPGGFKPSPSPRPSFVPRTSLPSALTPQPATRTPPTASSTPPADLNKLQARVLRAKLMNEPNAGALQREYEEAVRRAEEEGTGGGGGGGTRTEMVPVIDGLGRLYDLGSGAAPLPPGNERNPKALPTHDRTGALLRVNDDDDTLSLGEMLRAEKATARSAGADMDAELAGRIMRDGKFEDDLEYMDDQAEVLARKKMRTDAMRRAFAINDYARTKKALDTCPFCHGEDDSPPKAGVVAHAPRAYLAVPTVEELVEGHCYIVPVQHHLTMLEADDEVWDEVKNFMKCLMQMYNEQGKAPLFWETVVTLKHQKHTFIECVPLPISAWQDAPAYFRESILASESDWTQHAPLIDFTKRPGGFRRMMVKDLPYFMVQWDYRGEKGYGHVIEGDGGGAAEEEGEYAGEEEGRRGKFPPNFAAEVVGSMLEIEPRKWRRPRRIDYSLNAGRARAFGKAYAKFDWTPQLRTG